MNMGPRLKNTRSLKITKSIKYVKSGVVNTANFMPNKGTIKDAYGGCMWYSICNSINCAIKNQSNKMRALLIGLIFAIA